MEEEAEDYDEKGGVEEPAVGEEEGGGFLAERLGGLRPVVVAMLFVAHKRGLVDFGAGAGLVDVVEAVVAAKGFHHGCGWGYLRGD